MTVRLTDDEYQILATEAEQTGLEIEALFHELVDMLRAKRIQLPRRAGRQLSNEELLEYLYEEGVIGSIPTGEPLSEEEEAERKRLAELFGHAGGKPASEMVIEDRGPY